MIKSKYINVLCAPMLLSAFCSVETKAMEADQTTTKAKMLFENGQCLPVGGLGVIEDGIFIVLETENNELLVKGAKGWVGKTKKLKEVVALYKGRIVSLDDVPDNFSLNESIIVSFEIDRVVFFSYRSFRGGFYTRQK